jgi:hypothetical protein
VGGQADRWVDGWVSGQVGVCVREGERENASHLCRFQCSV